MALLLPGLIAVGIAFSATFVLVALGRAIHRQGSAGLWSVPIGLGAGYALGHAWLRGWLQGTPPQWPPADGYDWIAWLALAVAIIAALDATWPTSWWSRWINRTAIVAAVLWCLVATLLGGFWSAEEGPAWLAALGASALLVWGILDWESGVLGRDAILPVALWAAATGVCMQLCHSLILAELGMVLAGALFALWIVSRWSSGLTLARGGVPVVVTVLSGIILYGRFYNFPELPAASAIALAVAPLVLWFDQLPPMRSWRPLWRGMLRIGLLLVPLGIAIGFALQEFLKAGLEGY